MAQRQMQNYLDSGEITDIKIGGTANSDSVAKLSDIEHIPANSAYCCYGNITSLALTNVFQKVSSFNPLISPQLVSFSGGTFTVSVNGGGVWVFDLERIYTNEDTAPTNPVRLYIEMRLNGVAVLTRDAIIGAATSSDEPATIGFNTSRIVNMADGDQIDFYAKAQEEVTGISPVSSSLVVMEVTAQRLFS